MGSRRPDASCTIRGVGPPAAERTVLVCGGSWYGTVLSSCELYHP